VIRRALTLLACAVAVLAPRAQAAPLETSLRLQAWSSDRLGTDDTGLAHGEIWVRGGGPVADNVRWRLEAAAGTDPVGLGEVGGDVREAYLRARTSGLQIRAGRQIYAWGRADRLNPTDVIAPRDYRRLVETDGDDRRGIAALSFEKELFGGAASVHWLPEFRCTELPTPIAAPGLRIARVDPDEPYRQFALRYDRFGARFDWSITYAQVNDRLPWLALRPVAVGFVLETSHPKTSMWGGDVAATLGKVGVRAEAAFYQRDLDQLGASAARVPRVALVLGADRSFPGQININVQAVARISAVEQPSAGPFAAVSARNAVLQGAWRDATLGGTIRVRKAFAQDRGVFEISGASFSGGGRYGQVQASYALRDGLRAGLIAEGFNGAPDSLFGRLERNTLIAATLRQGF
jgi:hypothetical protein